MNTFVQHLGCLFVCWTGELHAPLETLQLYFANKSVIVYITSVNSVIFTACEPERSVYFNMHQVKEKVFSALVSRAEKKKPDGRIVLIGFYLIHVKQMERKKSAFLPVRLTFRCRLGH